MIREDIAQLRVQWENEAEEAAVACQERGLPVPVWPDFETWLAARK